MKIRPLPYYRTYLFFGASAELWLEVELEEELDDDEELRDLYHENNIDKYN